MNPRLFHNGKVQLYAGNCMEVLREIPDNPIDAVVTDPPYHLTSIVKRFAGAPIDRREGYLLRRSRTGRAHYWNGYDTACRMFSCGSILSKKYRRDDSAGGLPICAMCEAVMRKIERETQ